MSNMWEILKNNLERTKSTKSSNHQDISRFLRGEEEVAYAERQGEGKFRPSSSNEHDDDFQIGEDKDSTDFLREYPKLQMKELNHLKPDVQAKHLKQEYNRLYDRMLEMNEEIGKHEKNIMNLQMTKRAFEKDMQKMKTLIRNILYMFPGGAAIKSTVDTSGWKTEDIEKDVIGFVSDVLARVKNVDQLIAQETQIISEENKALKSKVVSLQHQVAKIDELEQMILSMHAGETPPPAPAPAPTPTPTPEPDAPKPFITPFIFPKEPVVEEPKVDTPFVFSPPTPPAPPPTPASPPELEPEEPEEDGDDLVLMNVEGYVEALNDESRHVMKVIGEQGFSRNSELRRFLEEDPDGKAIFTRGNKFNYQEMSQVVKHLRDTQLLDSENINIGVRGGDFLVFELSKLGKAVYKKLSGKQPVMSDKKRITNQHASVEHGYLIRDSAALFAEIGYTVLTERQDVSVKISNNRQKDFDLVLEKDDQRLYIEVERGTHTKEDFFLAMNKIKEVTNDFYFVCPNEHVKNGKTKRLFFQWITQELGGIGQAKGMTVHFATFEALKNKKKQKNPWESTPLG